MRGLCRTACLLLLGALLAGLAAAEGDAGSARAREYFTDLPLVNQHGESMRLYSDLLDGRKVVINAFFTSCTGVCPVINGKLRELQSWLGDRLGKEVYLLSLSVDPETDTSEELADYARHMGAKDGWYFLAGDPEQVHLALSKFGMDVESREAHSNLLFLGAEPEHRWAKVSGLDAELIQQVERFLQPE